MFDVKAATPARIAADMLNPRALVSAFITAAMGGRPQVGVEVLSDLLVPMNFAGRADVVTAVQVELDDALDPLVGGNVVERVALASGVVVYALTPEAMASFASTATGAALVALGLEVPGAAEAAAAAVPIPPHPGLRDRILERLERAIGQASLRGSLLAGAVARYRRRLNRRGGRA